jgi:hypothetical protein
MSRGLTIASSERAPQSRPMLRAAYAPHGPRLLRPSLMLGSLGDSRIVSRILVICIVVPLSACAPHRIGTYFTSGIRDYTGDGTIQDTSQRGSFFPTRSYMVSLPSFPLNRPYEHTFRLDGLPTIEGKPTQVAFFVPNSFSQARTPNARSTVELSITTADSKQVTSVSSTLGALIWSSPAHPLHSSGHAVYQLDTWFFQPVAGERYRLHVRYSPASGADSGDGYFYLRSGVGGS